MRSDEMLNTGKIHMEVNTMPGLIVYESEDERCLVMLTDYKPR